MPRQFLQPYVTSLASQRIPLYAFLSTGAVLGVILNALRIHSNFYSVAVYLSKSNGAVIVLGNFGILLALLCGRLLQQVFFGQLRALEVERLYDRMWFFVTESLLAFTIFRDEFDALFAIMFGILLFTKCFHWLLSDRIEWMDQRPYPGPPMLFHVRINFLMAILWATDIMLLSLVIDNLLTQGVGGIILFASEYAILLASLLNSGAKYIISIIELRRAAVRGGENAPPWEDKSMWIFYVELMTDFLKLVTYLSFFMLVLTFYGLPLNIIRDVYLTARSFIMRFRDLIRYRTATRNMDERYPNATEGELNAMADRTCIICREEMVLQNAADSGATEGGQADQTTPRPADGPNMTPKKLPCGHVFHFYCLRSWLERQQSCPTCRRTVLDSQTGPTNGQQRPPQAPQAGVPQPQNAFRFGAPGLPGQQQGPNQNFGRLFGRLMGAAGAPPIVPGQFAAGLPPQFGQPAAPQNGNGGWMYGAGQPPAMEVPPQQAPPEAFQGFQGPAGVWQPWDHGHDAPRQQATAPETRQDGLPSEPSSSTVSTSTTETSIASDVPIDSPNTSTEAVAGFEDNDEPETPRAAAALAALRRLNTQPNGQASKWPSDTTSVADGKRPERPNGTSSVLPPKASGNQASPTGERPPQRHPRLPTLIPLYNPQQQHGSYYSRSTTSVGNQEHSQPGQNASFFSAARQQFRSQVPPGTSHVTQEQLARLDRLTREAIDERLQILEGIQGTISQCVLDLLRIRSVLPHVDGQQNSGTPATAPVPVAQDDSSSNQRDEAQ